MRDHCSCRLFESYFSNWTLPFAQAAPLAASTGAVDLTLVYGGAGNVPLDVTGAGRQSPSGLASVTLRSSRVSTAQSPSILNARLLNQLRRKVQRARASLPRPNLKTASFDTGSTKTDIRVDDESLTDLEDGLRRLERLLCDVVDPARTELVHGWRHVWGFVHDAFPVPSEAERKEKERAKDNAPSSYELANAVTDQLWSLLHVAVGAMKAQAAAARPNTAAPRGAGVRAGRQQHQQRPPAAQVVACPAALILDTLLGTVNSTPAFRAIATHLWTAVCEAVLASHVDVRHAVPQLILRAWREIVADPSHGLLFCCSVQQECYS